MSLNIDNYVARTGMKREAVLNLLVAEAFMRRAALVRGPFALKGSLVLRQYLPDPNARIPGDIDWVGIEELDEEVLSDWVQQVTALDLDDGVRFRSFAENRFWRMIEYAMDDDFPTVNTDLLAWVNDEKYELCGMDVSFGLALDPPPVSLRYQGMSGDIFSMPMACTLELQLAWKLHQCMVRPRFKDLVDVLWLLRANEVNAGQVGHALRDECAKDKVPLGRFNWLLAGTFAQHPAYSEPGYDRRVTPMTERYRAWLTGEGVSFEPPAEFTLRDPEGLPASANELLTDLAATLRAAGFQSM